MGRKVIVIWLSLAMVLSFVVVLDVITDFTPTARGTTHYVNETGIGAYDKIQDAINAANDGDTVFVYNGTYYENVVVNKAINLTGENRDTTIIDGGENGDVIQISADWVGVTGFTIIRSGTSVGGNAGIGVRSARFCKIENNNCSNNLVGIFLDSAHNNKILDNNCVYNNHMGIYVSRSKNNRIRGNNCSYNENYGIYIDFCDFAPTESNIIENNICSHIIGFDGIFIRKSNYSIVRNSTSSNNPQGIYIVNGIGNLVENNTFLNNSNYNIRLYSSEGNTINNNTCSYSNYGIYLSHTSINNNIYHNIIIDNINQAFDDTSNGNQWDNGYPSGGNFWSDYTGVDQYHGPNQDIPGSDGIGDINYSIDSDSVDYYPLMVPYKPLENYTILKQGWNLISIPLIQEEQNLTRVLGSNDGWYDAAQWYDITDPNDPWKHHKVGKPFGNDLFELNETMGFWIHITQPGDTIFLYNGTQPTSNQTITFHPGWNLVGYPSLMGYNRTAGLNNLTFGTEVDAIWTYNATTQKWKGIGPSDYFEIGRGYWVHAKTKCEWEVPL